METMDFLFDAVLPPSSSQEDVYTVVAKPVVQVCTTSASVLFPLHLRELSLHSRIVWGLM